MNKIYRRIWNHAKQCWVVASESATVRGKRAGSLIDHRRAALLALLAIAGATGNARAGYDVGCSSSDGADLRRCLPFAGHWNPRLTPGHAEIDFGAENSLAIGAGALIQGSDSFAFGQGATIMKRNSVAFGYNAQTHDVDSIAIGFRAKTGSNGGHNLAVGTNAFADYIGATALGNGSKAQGENTVAIGSGASATSSNSVAIGANSVASAGNTVSVGSSSTKRRIVNVAPGGVSSGSADAVTGGQLYDTNQAVSAARGRADSAYAVANGAQTTANTAKTNADSALSKVNTLSGLLSQTSTSGNVRLGGSNSGTVLDVRNSASANRKITGVADATLSTTSTEAVSGKQLHATNAKLGVVEKTADAAKVDVAAVRTIAQAAANRIDAATLALGKGATAENGSYGISTALGNNAKAYNGRSVALGDDARAGVDADGNKVANQNAGVSVGAGTRSANGAVATGFRANASGNFSIAVGGDAKAQAEHTTAVGYLSKAGASQATALGRGSEATAQFASALGNLAKATNTSSVALGDRAQASHENAVALGAGAVTASANSVSVGSASRKRKIQYIADGVVGAGSTDAITGNQLHATNQAVTKAQTAADGATTTANAAKVESGKALAETVVLGGLVNQTAANGSVRLGQKNSGTQLDVRNSANANRRIMGVADGVISATSNEAVTGKQLHETNANVTAAQTAATAAKVSADKALAETGVLSGLVGQVAVNGNVRVGEKNSGTVLDVRNSANANRKLTGVADGAVSASSYDSVNGRQLNATNDKVAAVEGIASSAGTEAALAKTDAAKALVETAALGGLVAQVSASGSVRLGEKNSGTTLDVRNITNANRRISGVADGLMDAGSTDAVNGGQLHAVEQSAQGARSIADEAVRRIEGLAESSRYFSSGKGGPQGAARAGLIGVAIGDSAEASVSSEGAVAVGSFSAARGKNSVALGRAARVDELADNGFALGVLASVQESGGVSIGANSIVQKGATSALALGASSVADEAHTASFGSDEVKRRLTNVARGTADHNAATVSQLKDSLAILGGGAGMDGSGNIIAPTYTVQGGTQNTVEDALMALDGAVITAGRRADKVEGQLSSIFQNSPSARADGMSQIALNGVNGMVLTNLADGRVAPGSRDAVTGNQLYAAEQKISQNRNDLEAMRKEREMGQQAMRGLDASVIDYGGARLTGVAEAKLSADSSDVVRGSQLYETNSRVSAMEGISQYVSVGTAPEYGGAQAGPGGLAIGNLAKTGIEGGTAIGTFTEAMGKNSIAIGRASTVYQGSDSSFAIGTGAEVGRAGEPGAIGAIAFGAGSRVEPGAHGSIAFGTSSYAAEVGVVSFGSVGTKRRLINIANGTANHNAATVGQLRGALSALGGEVDANGNIVGPSFNVQGQSQSTLNGALEALDGAVVTNTSRVDKVETQLRSVFQDTPSVRADGVNQLTLAGANGMVISNVANGLIAAGSRDAVNGGQLHSMQQQLNGRMDGLEQRIDDAPAPRALASSSVPKPQAGETPVVPDGKDSQQVASVGEGDKPTPQPKANKDDSPKPQVDTAELEKMLARANEYTDGAISNFERRLDKMDKRFNRMAAMSSAQSAMAMNTAGLATYNRLGAGVGYSEGESAMAVGYQRVLNEKGSATFSLNGAFTNSGERSMGVGVGIGW
ncbi:MAG: YadA-like family protein [Stenotrophomonas sp.]|uniref:ESPR-type extended signal peptide-containing protein n=1 Tax=Stenotrophomonas sp. TaxID=69392 RepID=UPI00199E85B0|nr:ESPR-type extended signal peptide-containing protein [Stenotrophomonas sp.]MBD3741581.1 YadA-like family protein [Stenotrophomonas sp.]